MSTLTTNLVATCKITQMRNKGRTRRVRKKFMNESVRERSHVSLLHACAYPIELDWLV